MSLVQDNSGPSNTPEGRKQPALGLRFLCWCAQASMRYTQDHVERELGHVDQIAGVSLISSSAAETDGFSPCRSRAFNSMKWARAMTLAGSRKWSCSESWTTGLPQSPVELEVESCPHLPC